MPKDHTYRSLTPNADGLYTYSEDDLRVWGTLFSRQVVALRRVMTPDYLHGIQALGLSADAVPQVKYIDARLNELTRAGVEGVPAIIPPSQFYALLAQRRFPVATFLRREEEIDYIEEPDLFHEVFGHCPLLTQSSYADFIERFGQTALSLGKGYSWHLFRLFWFTIEFGMIETSDGLRGYGAGIASSPAEAANAMGDGIKEPFDLLTVFRTPYRIDIVQPIYFVIQSFDQLSAALDVDIKALIDEAKVLGDLPPLFEPREAG